MANKRKTNKTIGIWTLGLVAVLLLVIGIYTQGFSVSDLQKDVVYTPVFSHTECTVIAPDHTITYDWVDKMNSEGWITEWCSRNDHEVYTNRCELEYMRANQGFFSIPATIEYYECPYDVKFEDRKSGQCTKVNGVAGTISFNSDRVVYARATDGILGGSVDRGEIQVKKVANWYGLRNVDSNNYLSKEVTCDVSRIQDRGYTFLQEEKDDKAPTGILPFNTEMNYISAQTPTISKNIIAYNGKAVWTIGNGEVCNLAMSEDGYKYVNTQDCYDATDIICNPALPYCSDDGTEIINIDSTGGEDGGKTCSEIYGSFLNGWIPASKDPSVVCQYACSDEKLTPVTCKDIPKCEEGTLNKDYVCVTANVPQDGDDNIGGLDPTLIFIGLAFIVIILVMLVIKTKMGKNKGGVGF